MFLFPSHRAYSLPLHSLFAVVMFTLKFLLHPYQSKSVTQVSPSRLYLQPFHFALTLLKPRACVIKQQCVLQDAVKTLVGCNSVFKEYTIKGVVYFPVFESW